MADPPLLSLRFGRIGFGGAPLFDEAEVRLGRGERACLVGRNGSGKTTLMLALAGLIEFDEGERFVQPGTRLSYLPQDPAFEPRESVADHVGASGEPGHRVEAMLDEVGLEGDRLLGSLSGGEARRVAIARALVGEPDILFLDEPTNHLDLAGIEWLERLLAGRGGALLMVSHDRAFLANVTNRTYWLASRRVRRRELGFSGFEAWSEEVLAEESKAAQRLDARLAQESRWLLRGITARRKRNQGRLRKLEEMRATRAAIIGGGTSVKIRIEESEIKSRLVLEAKDAGKSFGEGKDKRVIVRAFSTRILRGDRIGLIGPNGAGKTTLLRMLTGELAPDRGTVKVAKHLRCAYFDQKRESLDPAKTLWETLVPGGGDQIIVRGHPRHIRAYLKDFLFDPKAADSPVGSLSGGERNRLLLMKILAAPSDFLVLDEPTNDLDMDTLDILQEALADYAGTLLLVSHDRDFLDRTVTSTIALTGDGEAREFPGGYQDYLRQSRTGGAGGDSAKPVRRGKPAPARSKTPRNRLTYKDQYELERLPRRIETLGGEIAGLESDLADAGFFERDRAGFEAAAGRLDAARGELSAAEERWLELEEKSEEATSP
ncbi:MAG: ABC-F family ATP-binding cassette domain-containing protein [Alphaproteobacteria bacterium]